MFGKYAYRLCPSHWVLGCSFLGCSFLGCSGEFSTEMPPSRGPRLELGASVRAVTTQTSACGIADIDQLLDVIADDLSGADPGERAFYRYVTLANRARAVGCGPQLDGERHAFIKLVNSLSIKERLRAPLDVDGRGLVYRIDLRHYDWDRAAVVDGRFFDDAWEAIAAHNPYAVSFVGDQADEIADDTGTAFQFMFADSLLAAAAVDGLYYALLDIDVNLELDDFISDVLGVDVFGNLQEEQLIRAGFSGASLGLPGHSFLAERHEIESWDGYMWQISDFGDGARGIEEDPLGSPRGDSELVFTLPNGLLGFALAEGGGELRSDSDLLVDSAQANSRYRIAVSPLAKFAQGVDVADEVRARVLAGPDLLAPGNVRPDEVPILLRIYPEAPALAGILDADRRQYAAALERLGLELDDGEPISGSFAVFNAGVGLAAAAGDLLVSSEELADELDNLDPGVQVLGSGGEIDRNDWTRSYLRGLCISSSVLDNQPDSRLCDAAFETGP